jgi:hypothetical protein
MSNMFARIKEMNKGAWEYIKLVSKAESKTIPLFIYELVELHAKTTQKVNLLNTILEVYSDKLESNKLNRK